MFICEALEEVTAIHTKGGGGLVCRGDMYVLGNSRGKDSSV